MSFVRNVRNGVIYGRLPEAIHETEMGKALSGQLSFATLASKTDSIESLQDRLAKDANDFDARFDIAIHQISQHRYDNAIENLLFILKASPEYKEGAAREMLSTISNMISPVNNDLAKEIRRKLSNLIMD